MMDKESEKELAESVRRILEHADMNLMTESKVRKLAAEDTGLDLNIPAYRKVVKRIIEEFFSKNAAEESDDAAESGSGEEDDEESKPTRKEKRRVLIHEDSEESEDKPSSKKRIVERSGGNGEHEGKSPKSSAGKRRLVESEEEGGEASSDEEVPTKKQGKSIFKKNEDGDIVVCQLGPKRNLTVQDFRGKLLVSIREYYQKNGKQLPGAKGVSLTIEQWEALKEGVPEIEAAIKRIQRC